MKQGSTIVGPLRWWADLDLALIVGDRCRRRVGLVVLYDPRMRALAGTAELRASIVSKTYAEAIQIGML